MEGFADLGAGCWEQAFLVLGHFQESGKHDGPVPQGPCS